MGKRMTWNEIKQNYPNEWVAVVNYSNDVGGEIEGEVLNHSGNKNDFYQKIGVLLPKYSPVAIRYTGVRIKNPEVPSR